MVLSTLLIASVLSWIVPFFSRLHGLDVKEAGKVVSIAHLFFGAVGALIWGRLADIWAARSPKARAILPAVTSALMAPIAIVMFWLPDLLPVVILYAFWSFLAPAYFGASYALLLSVCPPRTRGSSVAIVQVACNLLGYGFGPFLVGMLSDAIGGPASLRYALCLTMVLSLLAAASFALASRTMDRDLGRAKRG
jgi:MFS family permease